jgi:DNA mismatch repair protein MutS
MKTALYNLLAYLSRNNPGSIFRFSTFEIRDNSGCMEMNFSARRNLEIFESLSRDKKATLIAVMDKTKTAAGRRELVKFLECPLTDILSINERLDAVEELKNSYVSLSELRVQLSGMSDIARIITRIASANNVGRAANPRDVYGLMRTLSGIKEFKGFIGGLKAKYFIKLNGKISDETELAALLTSAINIEPPASVKDGGVIKYGFDSEFDYLYELKNGAEGKMSALEMREKELTGIKNLKISYNRVFGYYIEVSKSNLSAVPTRYNRKQTLANGERYITDELKRLEDEILSADTKILAVEERVFKVICNDISARITQISDIADALAKLDVIACFAECAVENNYTRPDLTLENIIDIKGGRHPVIEKISAESFTPNDIRLSEKDTSMIILTGPNMSGKSTYMRQAALITIMAQCGSFVPADKCLIGVADKVFTRIGASDDIAGGKSTFMVEMSETAEIITCATAKSLVILDEIGRGTSTFDGVSIAKAVAEYIAGLRCRTLFATHYHELASLETGIKNIGNYSVVVRRERTDNGYRLVFLHKIVHGAADKSYGIEVAKIAGLPDKLIRSARKNLAEMEKIGEMAVDVLFEKDDDNQLKLENPLTD